MYINLGFFIGCLFLSSTCPAQVFNSVVQKKLLPVVEVENFRGENFEKHNSTTVDTISSSVDKKTVFSLPLKDIYVTSLYGYRSDPFSGKKKFHQGIDLRAAKDSVFSMMPGVVAKIGNDKRLGLYVVMEHGIYSTIYGHLSATWVQENQFINAGTLIAYSGNTGKSTGSHLHLALRKDKKFVDPLPYIKSINGLLFSVK